MYGGWSATTESPTFAEPPNSQTADFSLQVLLQLIATILSCFLIGFTCYLISEFFVPYSRAAGNKAKTFMGLFHCWD